MEKVYLFASVWKYVIPDNDEDMTHMKNNSKVVSWDIFSIDTGTNNEIHPLQWPLSGMLYLTIFSSKVLNYIY